MIIPTDELIFFRGVGQPPARYPLRFPLDPIKPPYLKPPLNAIKPPPLGQPLARLLLKHISQLETPGGASGRDALRVQSISTWAMACIGPYSQALTMMGHTPKSTGSSLIGLVEGTILPENHGKPCIWWGKRSGLPVDFPFNQSIESLKHWWIIYYFQCPMKCYETWVISDTPNACRAPLPAQRARHSDVQMCSAPLASLAWCWDPQAASCRLEPGHWGDFTIYWVNDG